MGGHGHAEASGGGHLCARVSNAFHSTCSIGPTLAVQNNMDPAALTRALLDHFNVDLDVLAWTSLSRSLDELNDPSFQQAISKADQELADLFDAFVKDPRT